jgi:sugar/nucleoside kinase (ribokinase family)
MNTYLGASINLQPNDISEASIQKADLVYVEGYLYDAPKGPECWNKIGELSKKWGTKIAISLSDSWCVDRHREKLKSFLKKYADIVVCNNEELKLMFGGTTVSAIRQLRKIVETGSVTNGEHGALAFNQVDLKKIGALNKDQIIDTTGAGDFYAAGYILGQILTSDLSVSLDLGSMLAANAIKQIGASPNSSVATQIFNKYPIFAPQ